MKRKRAILAAVTGWLLVFALAASDIPMVYAETEADSESETLTIEQQLEEREVSETEAEITEISTVEDFLVFAKGCQMDAYSYGRIFSLTTDLDLSGKEFDGIPYFEGTFLGNGHTVSGMDITARGSDYGFFRYVGLRGVVKELKVAGKIKMDGSALNVGGFAGVNKGIVADCGFEGEVTGIESAGGLAGCNKETGVLLNCFVKGTVTATDVTGGVCGQNEGIIKGCSNEADVNVEDLKPTLDLDGIDIGTLNITQNVVTRNDMGGIAGVSKGTIADCTNEGTIGFVHTGYNAGGIVGRHSGTMINCTNKGTVYGRKDVGGITGQAEPFMESEYLSDRLEKIREDFNRMNNLVVQMSNALSETSSSSKQYTQALQKQYEDTIASLSRQVNSLQGTIAANNEQTKAYLDSLTRSMENMGSLGNDTVNRVIEDLNNGLDDLNGEFESQIPKPSSSEQPTSTEPTSTPEPTPIEPTITPEPSSPAQESSSEQESGAGTADGAGSSPEGEEPEGAGAESLGVTGSIDTAEFRKLSAPTEPSSSAPEESSSTPKPSLPELPSLPENPSLPELPSTDPEKLSSVVDSLEDNRKEYEPDPEIQANLDKMHNELISVTGNIKDMQNTLSNSTNSAGETAGNIADELERSSKASGKNVNGLTDSLDAGIQAMTRSLNGIMSTSGEISDYVGEDIDILLGNGSPFSDISSIDVSGNMRGVITGCVNYGTVEADLNTGGIAGTMNVEYDINPEWDFDLTEFTDVAVRATVNDVVLHCKNYGTVKIKKNNCGGIAGSSEMGIIFDCENYGGLQSDNGKRMGGIVGMSSSNVESSYTFCNIEGKDYLGGICGEGCNINNCISLSSIIKEEGEFAGSIAGTVQSEASVSGNYFSESSLGGIDNINYYGKAEPVSYETIMQMPQAPQGFKTVTIAFEVDEESAGTIQIPYGSSITEEQLPEIENKEDAYLCWENDFPIENVTENLTLQAEQARWILSVSSDKKTAEGKSYALAEGRFYEESTLVLTEYSDTDSIRTEQPAYAYRWSIEKAPAESAEYKVHLLIPEGFDGAQVFAEADGGWKEREAVSDGSYLIVQIPYGAAFAVYGTTESSSIYYIAAAAGALLVLLAVVLKIRKNRKKVKNGLVKQ